MIKEEIIPCAKSGGDLCYKTQVNPEVSTYMSLSCGFWTNSLMKEGSDFYKEQIETLPELYKELAWTDPETELIWLPTTINEPNKGMIFAYGPNAQNWGWAAVKAVEMEEEEFQKKFKRTGVNMKYKMDMTNMQMFHERDFIEALSAIGLLPE
jgi:hypothetical protein